MEQKALSYFSSINPLARKIIRDQQLAQEILKDDWEGLSWQDKETVLDDFFVDSSVREKYVSHQKKNNYAVSFPKLTIQSGEKIIVDMDSDFWSRQDEHSAPFSWKSKSQQDLTIDDLDHLCKNQNSRAANKSKQNAEDIAMAPSEFVYKPGESVWESEKYKDWKKNYSTRSPIKEKLTLEKHGVGNSEGLVMHNNGGSSIPTQQLDSSSHNDKETFQSKNSSMDSLPGVKQSPVPPARRNKGQGAKTAGKLTHGGKVPLSSSFSKKRSEEQEDLVKEPEPSEQLKDYPKAHKDIESNVFDNPVMNVYERSLMEEEVESGSSTTSSPSRRPLLQEPGQQKISREAEDEETIFVTDVRKDSMGSEDTSGLLTVTQYTNVDLSVPDDDTDNAGDRSSSIPTTGFGFLDNW